MTDFETFFAGEFQRLLERTSIPGMGEASWDRRAAWLLWRKLYPQISDLEVTDLRPPDIPATPASSTYQKSVFD